MKNTQLVITGLHQPEQAQSAEHLNAQLQARINERIKAEEALRASEERYRTLFDLGPVAVYTCDASGVIQDYNRAAVELWGRQPRPGDPAERYCGSSQMRSPDGAVLPHDLCPMADVLSGKIPEARDKEVQIERPDGTRVVVIVNIRPLRNDRGEITGAINCFVDITARKQMEEAKAKLAAIVESSDDAIISKDLNGVITSWNRGAQRLFGYAAQEAIGQCITMLIPNDHVDEEPRILERLRRGESIDHYETVRRRKDGTLLDISLTVSPLVNARREIVGASKVARDITERKQAQERLRASEARFRQVADTMPQIVWAARPDGYIDYYNERWYEFTGLPHHECGQAGWRAILHPADVQRCMDTYFSCIREGRPLHTEYRFLDRTTGGYRWFMGRALPVRNERGEIVRWFGTCTDIDDQIRAQEVLAAAKERLTSQTVDLERTVRERTAELTASNKQLEAFVYSIAHDLRAPLRAMQGFAELLVEEAGTALSKTGRDFANRINHSAQFLDALLRDLLAFAQLSQTAIELAEVDLQEAAQATVLRMNEQIQEHNARVEVLANSSLSALAHPGTLGQVLTNLIGNAMRFVAPGVQPAVKLGAEARGASVRLWVEDNGIGIAPEHQQQIFRPFLRLHGEAYGGTGIGLAIVQKGVERMKGRVGVESTPGAGSRFWIELPKA